MKWVIVWTGDNHLRTELPPNSEVQIREGGVLEIKRFNKDENLIEVRYYAASEWTSAVWQN